MYRPIIGAAKCIVDPQPKFWRGHGPRAAPPMALGYARIISSLPRCMECQRGLATRKLSVCASVC